ncbi:hypothetical protein OESDEN_13499 [Oesophagostomum dentatum]|uniref:Reverse transcriptase domain-containing protein n=1 Tax=Oesophagostomum dentatum TaxID=61180 RepID=A0A0B1SS80_OESDE|nr:hypothetical protein OESDEN_13499 [Oesophagostomum dentatum]
MLAESSQGKQKGFEYVKEVEQLVKQFSEIFAVTDQKLSQIKLVKHDIETGNAAPIRQKARPIHLATRVEVELRRILDDLQTRGGKHFFSTLDLISAYWPISLSKDAKQKSAFTATENLYQFYVLPFGLSSSPAVFQRLMRTALKPLLGEEEFCYLDDIIIATDTAQRHVEMMEKVFRALRVAGLRLDPKNVFSWNEK